MIKFTQTRRDWNDMKFAARMLRAGVDGYKSMHHDIEWDDYILLSTATEEQLRGNYTTQDLLNIFEKLENVPHKSSKEFRVGSGETVELYWEIDRFSKN